MSTHVLMSCVLNTHFFLSLFRFTLKCQKKRRNIIWCKNHTIILRAKPISQYHRKKMKEKFACIKCGLELQSAITAVDSDSPIQSIDPLYQFDITVHYFIMSKTKRRLSEC